MDEEWSEGFIDAVDTVEWRWRLVESASNALTFMHYMTELSNAISDMASYLPNYNPDTGEVDRPEY